MYYLLSEERSETVAGREIVEQTGGVNLHNIDRARAGGNVEIRSDM